MNKKASNYFNSDYLLVTLLLIFSGDPIVRLMSKYTPFLLSVTVFVFFYNRFKKNFYVLFCGIASGLLLVFIWQYALLGFVSWLGAFNYINTFLLGGLIIYLVGDRFAYKFFIVMSYISIISLVLFVPLNIINIKLPGLVWGNERVTYIIYTYVEEHRLRNCGIFWEPGAFAGILTLCLALNVSQFVLLWQKHKLKFVVIIAALLTTKSTTGYVVFFLIGCYFLLFYVKDKTIAFFVLPLLFIIGIVVYTSAAFLRDKVEYQSEESTTLTQGEFSNTRFGSFIFDMHYIEKHPIIGNGFDESTRYADNPELIQLIKMGVNLANGNGLSNYIACLGIPFLFFYLLLSFKGAAKIDLRTGFLVTLVITLLLVSEQWLTYPLFAGIMFLNYKKTVG